MSPRNTPRPLTRREFLTKGLGLIAVTATVPSFLSRTSLVFAADPTSHIAPTNGRDGKILVVIQLSGGNDGLNTIVPYAHDPYYRARPILAVPKDKVLKLNGEIGLHPVLTPLKEFYDAGKLTVLQGVGYPNPDRSHFRSMEIWQTAVADNFESTGWIGRLFDHTCGNAHLHETPSPTLGVCIGETLTPAMNGHCPVGVALRNSEQFYRMAKASVGVETASSPQKDNIINPAVVAQLDFLRRTALNAEISAEHIRHSVRSVQTKANYPPEPFAQGLKLIAAMIAGGMDTRVYYTSLGSFDTHANQQGVHEHLLKTFAEGVAAFQHDLEALGQADRVVVFTFSEFGRRVAENGSRGTDHGQAAPLFVFGKPVKVGIVGPHPSLEQLTEGDVVFQTDFRQLYATILDRWLSMDSSLVLGQTFKALPILA